MVSTYLDHLETVVKADVAGLKKAQESYGNSWIRRGGVGVFMMLARKWDRLENALRPASGSPIQAHVFREKGCTVNVPAWDIITAAEADPRSEGIIDDIRDLRRYLVLVEAELIARGVNPKHRDNEVTIEINNPPPHPPRKPTGGLADGAYSC